jgi:hypothetical protein
MPRVALRTGVALGLLAPVLVAGLASTSADGTGPGNDNAAGALAAATDASPDGAAALFDTSELAARAERVSRSAVRQSAVRVRRPVTLQPRAVDQLWATAPLNVWAGPSERTERLGLIKEGTRLAATGQRIDGFAEVLLGDKSRDRWVNARYLATERPKPPKPERSDRAAGTSTGSTSSSGLSSAACPDGSSIEAGLTSNADVVYRAVCNAYPSLTTYGGLDPHGEHYDGRAIDFMTGDSALGSSIAEYLRANAGTLQVRNIIWAQRIWSSERAGEGWRSMSDRGSATANHYDHVHVSVH